MTHQRKVLIGFSLALTVALTGGFLQLLVLVSALRARSLWAVLAVAVFGLAFLALGRSGFDDADTAPRKALTTSEYDEEHPLSFFKKLSYWGCILILSVVPMFFVSQRLNNPLKVSARPMSKAKVEAVAAAAETSAKPAATKPKFPQLTLTGMICNGPRSTAAINGQTVKLGERIEGVQLVAVERWGITVEMDDHQKHFTLQN